MKFLISTLIFLITYQVHIAQEGISSRQSIHKLIDNGALVEAKQALDNHLEYYRTQKNYDSLVEYFEFVGSFTLADNDKQLALKRSESFAQELFKQNNPTVTVNSTIGHAGVIYEAGKVLEAYNLLLTALPYIDKATANKAYLKYETQYDLGFYSQNIGNYINAKEHYLQAIKALDNYKEPDHISYQRTYNAIAGIYWGFGKMDTNKYYFEKSLASLKKAPDEGDFMNEYYRPALLKMNMAVASQALGKSSDAISFTEGAVNLFQKFLNASIDEKRKLGARKSQLVAIDNLGVFYSERGEFKRAEDLITYSYSQKEKFLEKDDPNIIISKVILAQSKINTRDLDGAAQLFDEAISQLEKNKDSQSYWLGISYTARATVYKEMDDFKNADILYEKGEQLSRAANNNAYTKEFIEEIGAIASFHAQNGNKEKSLKLATEAYNASKKGAFKNTIREFNSTINLAEIYYELKDYSAAKKYSDIALNLKYNISDNTTKLTDSILLQFEKPKAIAIHTSAIYELENNKSEIFLLKLLKKIEEAFSILDQRKTILKTHNDLTILINQNQKLFNLAKKLNLELYELTQNGEYLNDIIELHESNLYNRIRSRLNLRQDIAYSGVPPSVLKREQSLKKAITVSIEGTSENGISNFFDASKVWNKFLDSIQTKYPAYYNMRYATIKEPLDNLQVNIPKNTTVVRYLFIEEDLHAVVVTNTKKEIVKLRFNKEGNLISKLQKSPFDEEIVGDLLRKLYSQIWQPIENKVSTTNVIIIPDGPLFNLSFEILTKDKLLGFSEIYKNALLSKHNISYNYSLLLLTTTNKNTVFNDNLITFAPEFTSAMKQEYLLSIKDSIDTDISYLKLLPQPYSAELAKKSSTYFKGKSFLNKNSTEQVFKKNAKEHKIIHIGTHAESNNISPELSRLLFAKSTNREEDNSLYTYEIYNTNLASNLAILTACETGKPTYQPGEGMISLAHAFNYAGSESMLTSLWKIDEQSSTQIIDHFYENLKDGMEKDMALKQAKLTYLATAKGRTQAPQYWAGLVLIGDTSPIDLESSSSIWIWIFPVIAVLLLFLYFRRKK